MNTLYISSTGRVMLNENNEIIPVPSSRQAIDRVFVVEDDTKIIYKHTDKTEETEAKKGDLVVTFYEENFPHRVVVINNKEWKENLRVYEEIEQKNKEEWAKEKICDR